MKIGAGMGWMKAVAAGVGTCVVAASSAGQFTYVALGDSLGFGYEDFVVTGLSLGIQGYVEPFSARLEAEFGEPVTAINLSVPGEGANTFFNTNAGSGRLLNTNYGFFFPQSQSAEWADAVLAANAGGRPVEFVTLQIGVNDLLGSIDAAFRMLTPDQQLAQIESDLPTVRANIRSVYQRVQQLASNAEVYVLEYYNPYALFQTMPGLDPSGGDGAAIAFATDPSAELLNSAIEVLADEFGFIYVGGIFDAFDGNEQTLTRITTLDTILGEPNIHPTAAGYAVMAERLIDTAFPCLADFDVDGDVDGDDVTALLNEAGSSALASAYAQPMDVFDAFDVAGFGELLVIGCQ